MALYRKENTETDPRAEEFYDYDEFDFMILPLDTPEQRNWAADSDNWMRRDQAATIIEKIAINREIITQPLAIADAMWRLAGDSHGQDEEEHSALLIQGFLNEIDMPMDLEEAEDVLLRVAWCGHAAHWPLDGNVFDEDSLAPLRLEKFAAATASLSKKEWLYPVAERLSQLQLATNERSAFVNAWVKAQKRVLR